MAKLSHIAHQHKTKGGVWIGIFQGRRPKSSPIITPLDLIFKTRNFTPNMNFEYIFDQGWENLLKIMTAKPLYI